MKRIVVAVVRGRMIVPTNRKSTGDLRLGIMHRDIVDTVILRLISKRPTSLESKLCP